VRYERKRKGGATGGKKKTKNINLVKGNSERTRGGAQICLTEEGGGAGEASDKRPDAVESPAVPGTMENNMGGLRIKNHPLRVDPQIERRTGPKWDINFGRSSPSVSGGFNRRGPGRGGLEQWRVVAA